MSESSERRGRSSWSWLEEEEESDKRDEIESDSFSVSFSNGRFREPFSEEDVLQLLLRRCLNDLLLEEDMVLVVVVVFVELLYSFLRPSKSFQRLEQRGALGEKRMGSVVVMEVVIFLGEVVVEEEEDGLKWRGTSLPSEKS